MKDLERLFWKYVRKTSGCWYWTGSTNGRYGIVQLPEPRRNVGAHRASYMIHLGKIPKGLSILHSCDNPLCVKPDHLRLGTQLENMREMISKGRRYQPNVVGERNGRSILTTKQVLTIRKSQQSPKMLALKFGVEPATIYAIRSKRIWRHI